MKISCNWLKNYIELDKTPAELAEVLPLLGFDIESIEHVGPPPLDKVVVGQVLEYGQHPNADRLRVCKVSTGGDGEPHAIVCGAKNFETGDRVVVALPGAVLPGDFKIKKSKLRGEPSEGMLCSAKELQISDDHAGIMVLEGEPALGTPINEVYADSDTVLDLEVTPNRVDALCHIGIARELAAFFGKELRYPEIKSSSEAPLQDDEKALLAEIELKAGDACPHYTATCIRGVKVGPSPKWLKDAIEAIGLRPVNNVVDVTNYVLHETCQPLHAFDAAKIRGGVIQVRMAQEGETITTLDDKKRTLGPDMAVIADVQRALVVAGVMGSVEAEVDEETTDVVLEAAYFSPGSVRATSRKLGLSSDSSYRFERGVDAHGVEYAALRAVDLILEVAGGHVSGPMLRAGELSDIVTEIGIEPDAIRRFIGFEVSDDEIRNVFESLEMEVSVHDRKGGGIRWEVRVPSSRGDLSRPVDLIEEFIRVYGTGKIPDTEVVARGISENDHPIYTFNESVANYLTGQNFDEAFLYSLRDREEVSTFFGPGNEDRLILANPLQSDQSHLRPSLMPGLLDVLKLNNARGTGATRFFERGHVFREVDGKVHELISVSFVVLAGAVRREWLEREQPDFYAVRTVCESVMELAGVAVEKLEFGRVDDCQLWQPGHAASAGDFAKTGYECCCGLLNVETLNKSWDIDQPVFGGSILLTPAFFERRRGRKRHGAISGFPASGKDLALIVDAAVPAGRVETELAKAAKHACEGFACESVRVFDLYEGAGLPEGKKSLAFAFSFRAADRTLKDKEVNAAFDRIQSAIVEKTDFLIRK